jgi:hypothetical protein
LDLTQGISYLDRERVRVRYRDRGERDRYRGERYIDRGERYRDRADR